MDKNQTINVVITCTSEVIKLKQAYLLIAKVHSYILKSYTITCMRSYMYTNKFTKLIIVIIIIFSHSIIQCADAGDHCWMQSHLTFDYSPTSWTCDGSGGCGWLREKGWVVARGTTSCWEGDLIIERTCNIGQV